MIGGASSCASTTSRTILQWCFECGLDVPTRSSSPSASAMLHQHVTARPSIFQFPCIFVSSLRIRLPCNKTTTPFRTWWCLFTKMQKFVCRNKPNEQASSKTGIHCSCPSSISYNWKIYNFSKYLKVYFTDGIFLLKIYPFV